MSEDLENFPLEGVRVLDLSTEISGPYATKLLADAGAEVIKIESHEGDPLRRWKYSAKMGMSEPLAPNEDGALFCFLNTSKRSVVIDMDNDQGKKRFLRLVAGADLVVESFGSGRMQEMGLGMEDLQAVNPAVSLVSIAPWGQDGPWAERAATEFTVQAETGSPSRRGYTDRLPLTVGGRLGEFICGTFAAVGALSACMTARESGLGKHVDISLFESMLFGFNAYQYIYEQFRPGTLAPPYVEIPAIEPAKDGWVGFCVLTGQQWKDFCVIIERPDLMEDEELLNAFVREEKKWVVEAIQQWTRNHTVDEAVEQATDLRVPATPIGNGRTVLSFDHAKERGVFVENPAGFLQPRVPYRLSRSKIRKFTAAPALGQHTEEVFDQLDSQPIQKKENIYVTTEGGRGADAPLAGIKVVDFTAFWAGPLCTCFLAALGADVIKVESIQRPDGFRLITDIRPEDGKLWEWSPIFHGANSGKRGITLDLESKDGLKLAKQLIKDADVVIENFTPRVMENFGLGWEEIHQLNPDAVMVRMPAFGLDGPWRDRPGYAMTIEQVSGLAWLTGYPDRSPLVPRGSVDVLTGITTAYATLLALQARAVGGGWLVEVPLLEVGLNVAAEQVAEWTAYRTLLERTGNRGPQAAPQGIYTCRGGENIALAIENDAQWSALLGVLDYPDWAGDAALSTEAGRRAAQDVIDKGLSDWFAGHRVEDAFKQLTAAGIPAGNMPNERRVFPNPQLDERGFMVIREHPIVGEIRYPSFPMRFSGQYLSVRGPAPTLGQHNEEVLTEVLGLSEEEIEKLRVDQVIGDRPTFM